MSAFIVHRRHSLDPPYALLSFLRCRFALNVCVYAYPFRTCTVECAPLAYVCLCYNCTNVCSLKKAKRKSRRCAAEAGEIFSELFTLYLYFSSSISNGYLFALCLNERNKYKNMYALAVTHADRLLYNFHTSKQIHTHSHTLKISSSKHTLTPEETKSANQTTNTMIPCRSFQTTIKISNANTIHMESKKKKQQPQHTQLLL